MTKKLKDRIAELEQALFAEVMLREEIRNFDPSIEDFREYGRVEKNSDYVLQSFYNRMAQAYNNINKE